MSRHFNKANFMVVVVLTLMLATASLPMIRFGGANNTSFDSFEQGNRK